jgi:hypothetical protein
MINLGYNNRWLRLVKDLLFVALGCWLVSRGGFFAIMVGIFALAWYGRDAWYQAKALWQEKHFVPQDNNISRPASSEDGKITVTRDAKEVDYEKE